MSNIAQSAHRNFGAILSTVQAVAGFVPSEVQASQAALRRFSAVWEMLKSDASEETQVLRRVVPQESELAELVSIVQATKLRSLGYVRGHIEAAVSFVKSEAFSDLAWQLDDQQLESVAQRVRRLEALAKKLN